MSKHILHIILFFTLVSRAVAQDPFLSQPFSANQFLSPASVGKGAYDQKLNANFRSQLVDNNKAYQTIFAGFDWKSSPQMLSGINYLGLGINVLSDQIMGGAINSNHVTFNAAYHIFTDNNYNNNISLGLGATYTNRSVDRTKLTFADQYDGNANFLSATSAEVFKNNASNFSMNAGVVFNRHTDNEYLETGASLFFQSKPDLLMTTTSPTMSPKIILFVNYETSFFETYAASFHASYINKNSNRQILAGAALGIPIEKTDYNDKRIYVGCYYRLGDALIPSFKLLLGEHILGMSYDIYSNQLTQATIKQNSFELTYTTYFGNRRSNIFRTIFD